MNVVFVQNDILLRVGTTTLAGVLKAAGHNVEVVVEPLERDATQAIRERRPDLVAFYATTTMVPWIRRRARDVKRALGVPIAIGGPHPSFEPSIVTDPSIDFACRGEGEGAVLDLLDALEHKRDPSGIPNIAVKDGDGFKANPLRPYAHPLDELPDPDFTPFARYRAIRDYYRYAYPVMTGRGCPYDCVFCFIPQYRALYKGGGKHIRWRSYERIIAEMKHVMDRFGVRRFVFEDDTFILYKKWLHGFGDLYEKELRAPFICQTTAVSLDDDTVALLKRMGCTAVRFGLESGDETTRMDILKKDVSNIDVIRAARLLKEAGLQLQTYNLFGVPNETVESALETFRMNRAIGTDFAWTAILTPYPGTEVPGLPGGGHPESFPSSFHNPHSPVEPEILHLQRLLQIFLVTRAPEWLVRKVISLRFPRVYHALYQAAHALSLKSITHVPWAPFLQMALTSRRYLHTGNPEANAPVVEEPVPAAPAPVVQLRRSA
jgi:radical SAM superfamily enzyme YgiQ (UPF0313 family)